MITAFRKRLEEFVRRADLERSYEISFKIVFGAVAAYANGKIFASCGKFGVALKLPGEVCDSLFQEGTAQPLKYFEAGHVKRNYAVLGDGLLADQKQVVRMAQQSAGFVQH
ncbi:MAG: hypothetical protein BMS9Abin32_029 [Gammaproteobacteria bacterium]|nr:MAG: hypothetical protein BMS9Abin32_029 [Gammaproteobacteria bacterium]